MMTTTMDRMETPLIKLLESEGIRDQHRMIIGGEPISQSFADLIEADSYAPYASTALREVRKLIERIASQAIAQN